MAESSTRPWRLLLFGNLWTVTALLLGPLVLLALAVGAAAVWGPPFGAVVYLLSWLAAFTVVPGLVCLFLALRNHRRRSRRPESG